MALADAVDGGGPAGLYVGTLDVPDGLAGLADLSAPADTDVYYAAALNPWLGDGTYVLGGGGHLVPVDGTGGAAYPTLVAAAAAAVPEPASVKLLAVAAVGTLGHRRARAGRRV